MTAIENIQNGARDILNAGLGLVKTSEAAFADLRTQIENRYTDLVARGAADTSDVSVELRRYLDQGIDVAKDLQTKTQGLVSNN